MGLEVRGRDFKFHGFRGERAGLPVEEYPFPLHAYLVGKYSILTLSCDFLSCSVIVSGYAAYRK